ncbi:hypothetical protein RR48_06949 [Papilio machaon]|uniref:Uncharacterized protein n=1 Tax=Papilio machaon TaxID=76193 RepID=A0A194R9L7_PAPMA|nr:hypothetical protein RR48_06949 [Papilio machaon]
MSAMTGPMNMGAVRRQTTEQQNSKNMALVSGVTTAEALTRQSCVCEVNKLVGEKARVIGQGKVGSGGSKSRSHRVRAHTMRGGGMFG